MAKTVSRANAYDDLSKDCARSAARNQGGVWLNQLEVMTKAAPINDLSLVARTFLRVAPVPLAAVLYLPALPWYLG
jgi:hypothetical protein